MPEPGERRLRAKRVNEHVKLGVSALNTLSLAITGAALVVPGVTSFDTIRWPWMPAAVALHLSAHGLLTLLRSEE